MKSLTPRELLHSIPDRQQAGIRLWMDEYAIAEDDLTLPLLKFLAGAADVTDDGIKQVLAALLEQEKPPAEAERA